MQNPGVVFESLLEPRVDFHGGNVFSLLKGGQQSTFTPTSATGFSNSAFAFDLRPPSKSSILDRIVYIQVPVTFTINATNAGTDRILQPGRIALRAYPLNSVTTVASLTLNSVNNFIDPSGIVHALSRFKRDTDLQKTFDSIFPSFEDTYQTYDIGYLSNNNPLAGYNDSTCYSPRGSYHWNITTNTATQAVFTVFITEVMLVSPLIFNGAEDRGLTWLDNATLNLTLANLPRMLSISPTLFNNLGINITSIAPVFGQPTALLNWITPRDDLISRLPAEIHYPFFNIIRYTSGNTTYFNAGQSYTITTAPLNFVTIPLRIYLYAKRSESDITSSLVNMVTSTDTFLQTQGVSVNFNNVSGLLSAATPAQLYQMSYQNGCSMSYPEWRGEVTQLNAAADATTIGTAGSIICIDPTKDFGLNVDLAPGVTGQFQFQANLSVKNVSTLPFNVEIVTIVVYDGLMVLRQSGANSYTSFVTRENSLNAPVSDMNYVEAQQLFGGGNMLGRIGSYLQRGLKYVKDNQLLSKGLSLIPHPIGQTAASVAKSLGYGAKAGARAGARGGARGGEDEMYDEDDAYGGMIVSKKLLNQRARR